MAKMAKACPEALTAMIITVPVVFPLVYAVVPSYRSRVCMLSTDPGVESVYLNPWFHVDSARVFQ